MSRGNGRMRIFLDNDDYHQFVQVFGTAVEDCEIECWNYCVMPNHYHATLLPTRPNLSDALRRVNSVYAQWWNKRHGRVGHVFQGRFKDQIVQRDGYFLALARYIAMNPVRAGLVTHPEAWEWSSYAATAGLRPAPRFLTLGSILQQFGEGDRRTLQDRFAKQVLDSPVDQHCTEDCIRSSARILGDRTFSRFCCDEAKRIKPNVSASTVPIDDGCSYG